MEKNYDRLMMTGPGKRLMDLDQKTRYGIEFLLYVATAVGAQKLNADSPLAGFFREVVLDAPPEIAKRLINGFREDYVRDRKSIGLAEPSGFGAILEDLTAEQLNSLLTWASDLTPDEFEQLRAALPQLTKNQLAAMIGLDNAQRKAWLTMFYGRTGSKEAKTRPGRSPELQEKIDAAHNRIREEHRQLRERKGAK